MIGTATPGIAAPSSAWRLVRYLARPLPAEGLAVVRIGTAIVVGFEVLQLLAFSDLILSWDSGMAASGIGRPLLIAWLLALVGLALGAFTLPLALCNFVCTALTFGVSREFEYHADYIYSGLALLFLFAPISERWSVDRLLRDLRQPANAFLPTRGHVARAWYLAFAFVGIALIYWDSVFHKFQQQMWWDGLGVWLPTSLPSATWLPMETLAKPVLEVKSIALGLGYLTLAFETLFVWLMWLRWPRVALVIVGVGLHAGILVAFPIPWFAAIEIVLYAAVIPVGAWARVAGALRSRQPRALLVIPAHDEAALRSAVLVRAVDVRSRVAIRVDADAVRPELCAGGALGVAIPPKGAVIGEEAVAEAMGLATRWLPRAFARAAAALAMQVRQGRLARVLRTPAALSTGWCVPALLMVFFFGAQSLMTLGASPTAKLVLTRAGLEAWNQPLGEAAAQWRPMIRRLAGITPHALFVDDHFRGYEHDVRVRHVLGEGEETLPIIDDDGRAGSWNSGRTWANWSFRVMAPRVDMARFRSGLERWLRFWADERGVNVEGQRFVIDVKKLALSWQWQPGALARNVAAPWQRIATVEFHDGRMTGEIPDIEKVEDAAH